MRFCSQQTSLNMHSGSCWCARDISHAFIMTVSHLNTYSPPMNHAYTAHNRSCPEYNKRDMTLSDSKQSDMGTRVIAPAREWWRAVLTVLLTEGLALEWSKSIEWVERLTTIDIQHVPLWEGHVLWVLSHSCESYSWYAIIHTHLVVHKSLMTYTSTTLCLHHGHICTY